MLLVIIFEDVGAFSGSIAKDLHPSLVRHSFTGWKDDDPLGDSWYDV